MIRLQISCRIYGSEVFFRRVGNFHVASTAFPVEQQCLQVTPGAIGGDDSRLQFLKVRPLVDAPPDGFGNFFRRIDLLDIAPGNDRICQFPDLAADG